MYTSLDNYWAQVLDERRSESVGCIAALDQKYLQKFFVREKNRRMQAIHELAGDEFSSAWEVAKDEEIEMKDLVNRSRCVFFLSLPSFFSVTAFISSTYAFYFYSTLFFFTSA